jgi:hypothetical protein
MPGATFYSRAYHFPICSTKSICLFDLLPACCTVPSCLLFPRTGQLYMSLDNSCLDYAPFFFPRPILPPTIFRPRPRVKRVASRQNTRPRYSGLAERNGDRRTRAQEVGLSVRVKVRKCDQAAYVFPRNPSYPARNLGSRYQPSLRSGRTRVSGKSRQGTCPAREDKGFTCFT